MADSATPLAGPGPEPAHPTPTEHVRQLLVWIPTGAAILVQMAFPFTDGGTLALTAASVLLLSAAAILHAALFAGLRVAAVLVLMAGGGGLLAEAIGVHTGLPFGAYSYSGTLGAELAGVPVLVPLAWIMMAWPAVLVARRLMAPRLMAPRLIAQWSQLLTVGVAAWALTAWDVFLDPQMVDAGHWTWSDPTPALPGVQGIPLTNFAGWLVVAAAISAVLLLALRDHPPGRPALDDAAPLTVYLWTYGSSVLAHAVFFGRPSVALVGGLAMGVVALPLALVLVRGRRA